MSNIVVKSEIKLEKKNIDSFNARVLAMQKYLAILFQNASASPLKLELLPQALMELGKASEMVELATEELYQQNELLSEARNLVEAERQRYQDLFEEAPEGYLVTDNYGIIKESNRAAATLFNIGHQFLLGKPIINFVSPEERHYFRNFFSQLSQTEQNKELIIPLQKRNGQSFEAVLTAVAVRDRQGKPENLRWIIRDITERKRWESALCENYCDLSKNRIVQKYSKGDVIPLKPTVIWSVCNGLVKLSTLCETGEEVIVGLATPGMVFGSGMTSLQTYQAIALTDVQVVSVYLSEVVDSPSLSHILLPKINQRLRQTETFLTISGRRRVEDRLCHLLRFLKQEIGQQVAGGTCLGVRLTHEDIASACCTTRVTITRLLGKLEKQGLISFDQKKHLILKDEIEIGKDKSVFNK